MDMQECCCAKHGDVESPWVMVKNLRCEPAFFAYFLCGGAAAKKVSAAPHRGNARPARRIADASDSSKKALASQDKKNHPARDFCKNTLGVTPQNLLKCRAR